MAKKKPTPRRPAAPPDGRRPALDTRRIVIQAVVLLLVLLLVLSVVAGII